ncbi:hypothetical protein HAX54_032463, partial [Datura stramonium]|nr:hypothetical protein [Datura stramonium]
MGVMGMLEKSRRFGSAMDRIWSMGLLKLLNIPHTCACAKPVAAREHLRAAIPNTGKKC